MKKIIFLYLVFLFISCKSSTDTTNLRFAYNENYKIDGKEKNFPLNKSIIEEYENINGDLKINIPLNKYLYTPEYSVFIGVSIDNSLKEVAEAFNADPKLTLLESKKVTKFYNLLCKRDNIFMVKTVYIEKKQKLPIVLTLVSKDSILITKIYNENILLKKVI